MASVSVRKPRGGSREKSARKAESRQPKAESPKQPSLDVAALGDVIEELRLIEHTIATLPGLVEHARAIANAFECDEPQRRDAIARLGMRFPSSGGGRDIDRFGPSDMRMPDDDLLEGMVDAVNAVVEAATWRIQRLARVLFRVAESQQVNPRKSTSQQ